jgi:hypothetical protein
VEALFNEKLSKEERDKLRSELSPEERTAFNNLLNVAIYNGERRLEALEDTEDFLNTAQERFIAFQKTTDSFDSSQVASSPPSTFIEWIKFTIDSFFDKKEMPQSLISKENDKAWGDGAKELLGEFMGSNSERIIDQKAALDGYKAMRNDSSIPMQPMRDTSSNPINEMKETPCPFDKNQKQSKDDSPEKSPSQHNKM